MKQLSGKELCRILEKSGWRRLRKNGSYQIHFKHGNDERISVPVHGNKSLKTGLLRHLMKAASLDETDL